MKNKKGATQLVLIILIVGSLVAVGTFAGWIKPGDIIGYEQVYKQNWGSVCCFKTGVYEPDYDDTNKYLDDYNGDSKTCNYNTEKCDIKIVCDSNALQSCTGKYSIDGIKYSYSLQKNNEKAFELQAGKTVYFEKGAFIINEDHTIISLRAQPYSLIQEENGRDLVFASCILDSDLRRKTEVTELNEIPFGQCQNYMTDFISVASKTYSYNGREVICQSRAVYEVDDIKFKDASIKKVQGERIAYVDCCPSENNCGDDFKFQQSVERECSISSECANGGDPYGVGQTTARKFVCENGMCVSKDFGVECTSTAVCISRHGEGYVCDLSPANFGKCIESSAPYICGDGYCDIGETKANCPSDCELECIEGERLVTVESKDNCVIGFPLYIGCDTIVEKKCVADGINWAFWFGIGIVIFVIFLFRGQIFAIIKSGAKRIGF